MFAEVDSCGDVVEFRFNVCQLDVLVDVAGGCSDRSDGRRAWADGHHTQRRDFEPMGMALINPWSHVGG